MTRTLVVVDSDREAALREIFLEEVDRIPGGDRIRRCIQCGTCLDACKDDAVLVE